jgi:hypothetical protein
VLARLVRADLEEEQAILVGEVSSAESTIATFWPCGRRKQISRLWRLQSTQGVCSRELIDIYIQHRLSRSFVSEEELIELLDRS